MPLFQKKTPATERRSSPTKGDSTVVRPTSASGSRRSLTKALAEVVNSRNKGDPSLSQKFKAPAVRPPPVRHTSEDAGDSSTAVESSSSGAKPRPAGRVQPTLNVKSSPLKQSTQLQPVPPSPPPTVGARALRSRKIKHGSSSSVTKLSQSLAPSPSDTPHNVAKSHVNSIRSPSPARNGSASPTTNNSPSPTIGRRVKPLPTASGVRRTASVSAPKSSEKTKHSSLRQPKARPNSAIYLSAASLPLASSRRPLTAQNLLANERAVQRGDSIGTTGNTTSVENGDVRPPGHSSGTERESSLTPSRDKPGRPVSPLPRRISHDSAVPRRRSSHNLVVSSASNRMESHSKENQSDTASVNATRNGTALPRPSGTGSIRGRHSMAGAHLLHIRGAAASRAPSDSSERHLLAKRRRSELPIRHVPTSQSQRPRPPARLDIPRQQKSQHRSTETTPSTPTTSSRSAIHTRAERTFSVPRKHVTSTPLADMTFSEIPEDDDEDAAAVSTAAFSFRFPSSVSSRYSTQDDADDDEPPPAGGSSRITPALFVTAASQSSRPSRQRQRSTATNTPSRSVTATTSKRLPPLRVNNTLSPDGPRHSFMPLEASFDRSQEHSRDDGGTLLSNIPSLFDTPSVVRGSASVASVSVMSEGSLILNESESAILHSPSAATNFSSPGGTHSGIPLTRPTSISRLIFDLPSSRSGAASPTGVSVSASGPISPQSVAGSDLLPQARATSLETELAELRAHFEERETVALTQQSRISSLESELSTLYSVTRARDAASSAAQAQLKQQLAGIYFSSASREWDAVRDTAEAEAGVVTAERHTLKTIFSSLRL